MQSSAPRVVDIHQEGIEAIVGLGFTAAQADAALNACMYWFIRMHVCMHACMYVCMYVLHVLHIWCVLHLGHDDVDVAVDALLNGEPHPQPSSTGTATCMHCMYCMFMYVLYVLHMYVCIVCIAYVCMYCLCCMLVGRYVLIPFCVLARLLHIYVYLWWYCTCV